MFLNTLSREQKELVLDLCIFAVSIDGQVTDAEEKMIDEYCREMQIENRKTQKTESYEVASKRLADISGTDDLKKITLELIALYYVDGMEMAERIMLDDVRKIFKLNSVELDDLVYAMRHMLTSYDLINKVLS